MMFKVSLLIMRLALSAFCTDLFFPKQAKTVSHKEWLLFLSRSWLPLFCTFPMMRYLFTWYPALFCLSPTSQADRARVAAVSQTAQPTGYNTNT